MCLLTVGDVRKQEFLLLAEMWDGLRCEESQEGCCLPRRLSAVCSTTQVAGSDQRVVMVVRERDQSRVPFHSLSVAVPLRQLTLPSRRGCALAEPICVGPGVPRIIRRGSALAGVRPPPAKPEAPARCVVVVSTSGWFGRRGSNSARTEAAPAL